jgi:hypothetical protein
MDFTECPLDENGYDSAFVVIDRLGKKSISIPCHKTITAKGMAEIFLTHWARHCNYPDSIVSDRGPQFVSTFWKELCRILGTKVKLTTAYNPNVDGQTEIMNRWMKQRLTMFCNYFQDNWSTKLPLLDMVQLNTPHETLGNLSPHQVLYGFEPRTSFDMINPEPPSSATERLNRQQAQQLAGRMERAVEFAKSSMAIQQEKMARIANLRRRKVDWKAKDFVLIDARNWKFDRPSKKLSDKWYGPVQVKRKVGESWEVDLPPRWKMHNVFHSHSLRKAYANPLPGQVAEPAEELQIIPNQIEYELEEVLASKLENGVLLYQCKWAQADDDFAWYPCADAMYAPQKVKEFHLRRQSAPGPPRNLPKWLRAYADGIDNYNELEDDRPMTPTARTQFFRRGG